MTVILLFTAFILSRKEAISAVESKMAKTVNENCIVIDAGHGGDDPGKIGINGSLEKDINLVIAYKLKSLLESQDYEVVMTRTTADGLYTPGTKNMKVEAKPLSDHYGNDAGIYGKYPSEQLPRRICKGCSGFLLRTVKRGRKAGEQDSGKFSHKA